MEKEKKPIYKKWWFWLIIILVIAIIGSGNDTGNKVTTTTSTESNEESSTSSVSESTQARVGEEVTTKDTKIKFVSADDYTGYSQYSAPKSGNKVIRTEFVFENVSNSDISLNSLQCYADGEKCEEHYSADDYKSPTLESLSKGKRMTAVVYYEVPENAESIVLEYESDFWKEEKIEFIVK